MTVLCAGDDAVQGTGDLAISLKSACATMGAVQFLIVFSATADYSPRQTKKGIFVRRLDTFRLGSPEKPCILSTHARCTMFLRASRSCADLSSLILCRMINSSRTLRSSDFLFHCKVPKFFLFTQTGPQSVLITYTGTYVS